MDDDKVDVVLIKELMERLVLLDYLTPKGAEDFDKKIEEYTKLGKIHPFITPIFLTIKNYLLARWMVRYKNE